MKIFLIILVLLLTLIPISFFGTLLYQERCMAVQSKSLKAFYDIKTLTKAVNDFKGEEGYIPESLPNLTPKYVKQIPSDPWGNEYIYKVLENEFKVYSLGSDALLRGDNL